MRKITILSAILILLTACGGGGSDDNTPVTPPANLPQAAVLVSPANNKTCEPGEKVNSEESKVYFSWNPSEYTDSYDLEITDLNTFQKQTIFDLSTPVANITLKNGTPYEWRVISKSNEVTTKANSNSWKFYLEGNGISNYAPFPATLLNPSNGESITLSQDQTYQLSWEGSDPDENDVLTYTLYLDKIDGKQAPGADYENLQSSAITVTLDAQTTYYWRVATSDGKHTSLSPVFRFDTK